MPIAVCGLAITAVKATRLRNLDSVRLELDGVRENRRFYLIDERDRMVNAKNLGDLTTLIAEYSDADERLAVTFPDGRRLEDQVRLGDAVTTSFYSEPLSARLVEGPWSDAVSEYIDRALRLVAAPDGGAVDRGADGAVSLISRASLRRLAEGGGRDQLDVRRFRMLVEVDGIGAHEEDRWVGREVRIGEAAVRFEGHVGRCLITSRNPDTGRIDVPTLDILRTYRRDLDTTEPLPFGIYGRVLSPGTIRVDDQVLVVDSVSGR